MLYIYIYICISTRLLYLYLPLYTYLCSYLDLILSKNTRGAQKFAQLYSTHHVDLYDDELQSLLTCTNSKQLDDEIIFLPGNRLLKKLKQHRFTLKLSQLANKMLVNYLNSTLLSFDMYGADDKQLLRAMVNDKLTIDVQSYDVLPSSSSSSSSGSSSSRGGQYEMSNTNITNTTNTNSGVYHRNTNTNSSSYETSVTHTPLHQQDFNTTSTNNTNTNSTNVTDIDTSTFGVESDDEPRSNSDSNLL